jgi:hypothetical protein
MTTVAQLKSRFQPQLEVVAQGNFERHLIQACFLNLEVPGPLCFNNFAYALRELLRHVFHRLAPEASLKNCTWYKPDHTSSNGVTRNHRAKYMIQGGLTDTFVERKLGIDIEPVLTQLSSAFKVLNSFTHVEPDTFNLPARKVEKLALNCLEASKLLLDNIAGCRSAILRGLSAAIDDHLLSEAISDTIRELDELATHYFVEGVCVESTHVVDIGCDQLTLRAEGSVEVELQYGSGSDLRNDIGAVMNDSFPFSAQLHVKLQRPLGRNAKVENFKVDTSSWYE